LRVIAGALANAFPSFPNTISWFLAWDVDDEAVGPGWRVSINTGSAA
jgi:hypothetical protein